MSCEQYKRQKKEKKADVDVGSAKLSLLLISLIYLLLTVRGDTSFS